MKTLKKIVAVLFAALLLGGPFVPMAAYSQNFQQTQNLYGVGGQPQTNHNSTGTTWGQEGSPSANTWSLGYSNSGAGGVPPTTLAATQNMTWDNTPALTAVAPMVFAKTQVGSGDSSTTGVYITTTVPVSSSYETVISSGGSITLTSTPNISTMNAQGLPLASGTFLIITSTATSADAVVFQDAGTLSGSALQLGAASRSISLYKTLVLIFDAKDGFWRELAYGNN